MHLHPTSHSHQIVPPLENEMIAFGMKAKQKDLRMEHSMETNLETVLAELKDMMMVLKTDLMKATERAWK